MLYEWASGNARKPIHYWILVGMDRLKEPELMTRTDALKGKLPLRGPRSEAWTRPICARCMMFNMRTWNRNLPDFPVSRIRQ